MRTLKVCFANDHQEGFCRQLDQAEAKCVCLRCHQIVEQLRDSLNCPLTSVATLSAVRTYLLEEILVFRSKGEPRSCCQLSNEVSGLLDHPIQFLAQIRILRQIPNHSEKSGERSEPLLTVDDACNRKLVLLDQHNGTEEVRVGGIAVDHFNEVVQQLARLFDVPWLGPLIVRNVEVVVTAEYPVQRNFVGFELGHGFILLHPRVRMRLEPLSVRRALHRDGSRTRRCSSRLFLRD